MNTALWSLPMNLDPLAVQHTLFIFLLYPSIVIHGRSTGCKGLAYISLQLKFFSNIFKGAHDLKSYYIINIMLTEAHMALL
jgi:hypothetical protein